MATRINLKLATPLTLFLVAVSLLLSGYAGTRTAPRLVSAAEPLVNFKMADVRTDDAMNLLADRYGVRVLFDERMPDRVSCTFSKIRLSEALLALAGPDRYSIVRDGKTFRIARRLANATGPVPLGSPDGVCSVEPATSRILLSEDPEALEFVRSMIEEGRLAEAEMILTRHVRQYPADADAHILLGNVYRERKMLVSARDAWSRALAVKPGFAKLKSSLTQVERVIESVRSVRAGVKDPTLAASLDVYLR